jgi:hypothetical protein
MAIYNQRNDNIIDKLAQLLGFESSKQQSALSTPSTPSSSGHVIRTAARPQQTNGGSIPSSRHYTTRKPSLPLISIFSTGVAGDYNHYRTAALKSTGDRAVSILTNDISGYIRSLDGGFFAGGYREGDLGENILVEGVDFDFFQIGERYKFTSKTDGDKAIVEIAASQWNRVQVQIFASYLSAVFTRNK